jgi:Ca2+-binding RTX toxin-like protein
MFGGAGSDSLSGGSSADLLQGGEGDDAYVFNRGDGMDTILDSGELDYNFIRFGSGILPGDVELDWEGSTLVVNYGPGDAVRILDFGIPGVSGSATILAMAFDDGTLLPLTELLNRAPVAGAAIIAPIATEDSEYVFSVPEASFTDPNIGDQLSYIATLANGDPLPTWLSFSPSARTFSGTPGNEHVGNLDIALEARDLHGLSTAQTFRIEVRNVNDAPMVANGITDQSATEDTAFAFTVPVSAFSDVDAGDSLIYAATLADGSALPSWLTFDAAARTFGGTPLNSDVGTLALSVTATDQNSLSALTGFTLAIQNVNDAPTVANPIIDQSTQPGAAFAFTVPTTTFADIDPADQLTYSATLANGSALPAWLSFDSTTLAFSGTPGAGDGGVVTIKVTAIDTESLSASDFFDLTVNSQDQILTGTAGNDVLTGGVGHDQLFGLGGNDTLNGGQGHDLLDGGTGTDTMAGGAGNDTFLVDVIGDVVSELANEGTDTVQTSLVSYTLGANVENLTLIGTGPNAGTGNALSNQLTGNSGANLLDGGAGADILLGGAGNDLYVVDHVGDTVVEQAGEGALDSVTSSVSYTLSANVENLVLTGSAAINGTGNNLNNVLTGNSAANVLTGLAGNDTYIIGTGDTVVEAVDGGTDTVVSGITHTLAANVEHLMLLGQNTSTGTGNTLDNMLNGATNLGANVLTGGAGNDTYVIGTGDTVVEASGGGTDTVQSGGTHTLAANVEHLTLTGTAAINGTGNGFNNVLTGNSANNVLSGAGGNDQLRGGAGHDTVNGGAGNDTYLIGRGDGQDVVQDNSGTLDKLLYDAGINPLDLVISRQANNLRVAIHGSSDQITVQNWYAGTTNRTETIQAGNGQTLLSTQVDQLIQAMAGFTQQTGLTWDQGIDQRPQDVQAILAASWQ